MPASGGPAEVFLAGAVRTAIGGFCGALADVPAPRLASLVVKECLNRSGVAPAAVEEVLIGNVIGAGLGQNVARQAAIGAGLPTSVDATTVNKVCGSGLKAVMLAAQAIRCGDAQLLVAGGVENMSAAPFLLPRARQGYRLGNAELVDAAVRDGLWDVYRNVHMGTCGDRCAKERHLSRAAQDDFAVASYQRAQAAQAQGWFRDEIVPVEIAARKGSVRVEVDEEPARFDQQKLRALKPAFDPQGTVTAGNASSLNDGAAAMVVLSRQRAAELGVRPEARLVAAASHSQEPEWFTLAPIGAIARLLEKCALRVEDVDLFEINEAFSVVPLAAMQSLNIPHERLNVHGGAVALGHPLGASGARILVTLLHALRQRGGRIGVAALCIGGGEAVAVAVERCD